MAVNKVVYGGETIVDLTADTVTAAKMLSGTTAHDKSGAKVTGTIPSQAAQTITPGTVDQTIASGKYLTGAQTIKGDANLVPENIASGVSIFGVEGALEAGGGGSSIDTITIVNETTNDMLFGTFVLSNNNQCIVLMPELVPLYLQYGMRVFALAFTVLYNRKAYLYRSDGTQISHFNRIDYSGSDSSGNQVVTTFLLINESDISPGDVITIR